MNEITEQQKVEDQRIAVKSLISSLESAAKAANEANHEVVQLCWDLGDKLGGFREENPQNFDAFIAGVGVAKETAKHWIRVRNLTDSKEELKEQNMMRQAMLASVVPAKESSEERVELAPPQTFYQWVNKSNSWLKKLEVGLVKFQKDQLKASTERLFSFLKEIHETA